MNSLRLRMLAVAAVMTMSSVVGAPARAATALPANASYIPVCATADSTMCKREVSYYDGTQWQALPDSIVSYVTFMYSSASTGMLSLQFNLFGELDPTIPVNTPVRWVIDTGSLALNFDSMTGTGHVDNWTTAAPSADHNEQIIEMRTTDFSYADTCGTDRYQYPDNPYNYCETPTNRHDYTSTVFGALWLDRDLGAGDWMRLYRGMWWGTNATMSSNPSFSTGTNAFAFEAAGPPLKLSGVARNVIFYEGFLPDSGLSATLGLNGAALASSTALTVSLAGAITGATSIAGGVTVEHVTTPVPGLLVRVPDISPVTAPPVSMHEAVSTHSNDSGIHVKVGFGKSLTKPSIRGRGRLVSKKGTKSTARFSVGSVSGAGRYTVLCTMGRVKHRGSSSSTTVKVSGLTRGTWSCSARASASTRPQSRWSTAVRFTAR